MDSLWDIGNTQQKVATAVSPNMLLIQINVKMNLSQNDNYMGQSQTYSF